MRNYLREFFWGKPPSDPKERKLLLKLDSVILSYVCLACEFSGTQIARPDLTALSDFTNYLDRANLANAVGLSSLHSVGYRATPGAGE